MKIIEVIQFHPPLCSLIGVDPKVAICVVNNCSCLLTLQTRNSRREDLEESGVVVKATIRNKKSKVNDLKNGKYEVLITSCFSHCSANTGKLHITIDDTAVQDFPYDIKFIDYNKPQALDRSASIDHSPQYIDISGNFSYISTNKGYIAIYDYTSLKVIKKEKLKNKPWKL